MSKTTENSSTNFSESDSEKSDTFMKSDPEKRDSLSDKAYDYIKDIIAAIPREYIPYLTSAILKEEFEDHWNLPPGSSDKYASKIKDAYKIRLYLTFTEQESNQLRFKFKGWYVGKNKMKCWKAAVRNWLKNNKEKTGNKNILQDSSNSDWHLKEDTGF